MRPRRTWKVFAWIVGLYGAALLPGVWFPGYLDSPIGVLALLPYLSVYLFHTLGVPWLLQNNGACGWGWCMPTPFGWAFLLCFWLGLAWGLARLLSRPVSSP
ncbi:MAG: hypothetical protein Q7U09_06445 [Hydrogenophaga sp.]|nr:hypothetical protein [Hydrogenophaga sp.]